MNKLMNTLQMIIHDNASGQIIILFLSVIYFAVIKINLKRAEEKGDRRLQ